MVITAPLSQFDIAGIPDEVYGVLMDVGMGDGLDSYFAISIYAINTGESSLKASSGTGVIGMGDIQAVSGLPKQIVKTGQTLFHQTKPAENYDYPDANQVLFYILTTSGVRVYKCQLHELQNYHPFYNMFLMFSTIKGFSDRFMDEFKNKQK